MRVLIDGNVLLDIALARPGVREASGQPTGTVYLTLNARCR